MLKYFTCYKILLVTSNKIYSLLIACKSFNNCLNFDSIHVSIHNAEVVDQYEEKIKFVLGEIVSIFSSTIPNEELRIYICR